jgi:acyl-coenzyme A synthetase/AMP-(fatty) acid ligase
MDTSHLAKPRLIPLWQWAEHATHPVLMDKGQPITADQLRQRAADWSKSMALTPGARVAVYHTDLFECLAILMAVWASHATACIPGDACEVTQQRLSQTVDRFVGTFSEHPSVAPNAGDAGEPLNHAWPPEYPAIEIYTSGSTGAPKPIQKTLGQLFDEIKALETLWPTYEGTVVLGSVSHHHFYGLMFRVLWPLCSSRPIERAMCTFTEDIFQWSGLYDEYHLISSPTHLSRINPELDWPSRQGRCSMIVSAAAPLTREDSLRAARYLGCSVNEIYGSSETGAIAWRVQQEERADQPWQPTPGSLIDQEDDGRLRVRAPFIREGVLSLADQIAFCEDRPNAFTLQGRADRIVKLEGKRISLTAIERTLLAHSEIAEVKALILKRKRDEIAIVAELTASGLAALNGQSRRAFTQHLMRPLMDQFEAVARPRRWRFVTSLPTNEQGKITQHALEALFDGETPAEPQLREAL